MTQNIFVQSRLNRVPLPNGSLIESATAEHNVMHSNFSLEQQGILNTGIVYWNLSTPALYEEAIRRQEGVMAHLGPLVVRTGEHTGRSPNDKFIVRESSSADRVWWGKVNHPLSEHRFEALYARMLAYLQGRELFIQDRYAGADPTYRLSIRFITETAWHSIFVRNLFVGASAEELANFVPDFTLIALPNFQARPEIDGIHSDVFIILNFARKLILIGGTSYAGEIKKSIFTTLNYLLPLHHVLPMHCAANAGHSDDIALFFGLSGTGKTTLSADSKRTLIGDDEHGWSDRGIFNFEGGCYAKLIRLSKEAEPEIYQTTQRFGSILENVAIDPLTRHLDLNDASLTENTRGAYPIEYISNASPTGTTSHPQNIIFLTADALGVLPPIAQLTHEQAMYHFLSGYTAKVAGTEKGLGHEPEAVFSACFGAPFMALHPSVYASLLGQKIEHHKVKVWLVNTGWTGGSYGVGERIPIKQTRAMLTAVLSGALNEVPTTVDPVFGLRVPVRCPGVADKLLTPRLTWNNPDDYDVQAYKLAEMFVDNFKQFADAVAPQVLLGGPLIGKRK
ncbi:MAG: phosphoenolpyruvate carboxykinase [Fischerella sp.]|uniref:phosphoenolpyruvate carboxykinase n=1 Tax=Fischerella sp. TaxID=1191 RepID=UPI0017C43776|nr:phosphoenolpyruvate carboxykinase [Fischerella sp.]NWF62327.1 phosphoenolpyruvate carboxykinase [Fischerella sp.]